MTSDLMTIRATCDAFDVTARTLRFYEAKELLFPIREGQKRLFTPRDRARLKLILRGKRFGFTLEEMRQLLNLYDGEDGERAQLREAKKIAALRLEDMVQRHAELEATITELRDHMDRGAAMLAQLRTKLHVVRSQERPSPAAHVIDIQPSDRSAVRKFARL